MKKSYRIVAIALLLGGCAGFNRQCASFNAGAFSADWIVVQNDYQMQPKQCWRLPATSIANEEHSDGIYWLDPKGGHLVHISGWYNRVQVVGRDWDGAGKALGIDVNRCGDGIYK